eukprot:GHVL01012767.1.p1 GENE.GHVL01012767.1~~GHVL01012767.1.p1  ORF type:complete len:547 (+),score=110.36 GHVL01012767.1:104-1744(+)
MIYDPRKGYTDNDILIFLPGIKEIDKFYTKMLDMIQNEAHEWELIRYHSQLPSSTASLDEEKHKVHIATNIAESSITLPHLKFVIDFGLSKVPRYISELNETVLILSWATVSSMNQRKGRVGRNQPGVVYRLIPKHYENKLNYFSESEMQTLSLEKIILQAKLLSETDESDLWRDTRNALRECIQKPHPTSVNDAIKRLKSSGALNCDRSETITNFGRMSNQLLIDDDSMSIRIAKLLFNGFAVGCFRESLVSSAILSSTSKRLLLTANEKGVPQCSYRQLRLWWSMGSESDLVADIAVFEAFRYALRIGINNVINDKKTYPVNRITKFDENELTMLTRAVKPLNGQRVNEKWFNEHVNRQKLLKKSCNRHETLEDNPIWAIILYNFLTVNRIDIQNMFYVQSMFEDLSHSVMHIFPTTAHITPSMEYSITNIIIPNKDDFCYFPLLHPIKKDNFLYFLYFSISIFGAIFPDIFISGTNHMSDNIRNKIIKNITNESLINEDWDNLSNSVNRNMFFMKEGSIRDFGGHPADWVYIYIYIYIISIYF